MNGIVFSVQRFAQLLNEHKVIGSVVFIPISNFMLAAKYCNIELLYYFALQETPFGSLGYSVPWCQYICV